jgi:polar amino acid transport system substrate-binding protein
MSRLPRLLSRIAVLLLLGMFAVAPSGMEAAAQTAGKPPPPDTEIFVGTRILPPFVVKEGDALTGFSIDLWNAIVIELGVKTRYVAYDTLPKLLEAVRTGRNVAGIAAISITSQRGEALEFSQPMFRSGLAIMVPTESRGLDVLAILFSRQMLQVVVVFGFILIVPAHLIWLLARGRDNGLPIAHSYVPGIFDAIFWCAESMAGAAQAHPTRVAARIAAILWIYSGIMLIAYFTAMATTAMTMQSLRGEINGPGDLRGKRVAVVEGSTSAAYTRELGAVLKSYKDFSSAAKAVVEGGADAAVYDTPIMMYYVKNEPRVQIAGPQFRPESYGIIFPIGSPLRRPVDKVLLKLLENGTYDGLYRKWFGQAEGGG